MNPLLDLRDAGRAFRGARALNLSAAAMLGFGLALAAPVLGAEAVRRTAAPPEAAAPPWDRAEAADAGWTAVLRTPEMVRFDAAGGMVAILAAVAVVVLAAAALNLVTLLLTRASARRTDDATRAALGAPPWRLARVAGLEGALVGGAGGLAGAVLGVAAWVALSRSWPADPVPWWTGAPDPRVLLLLAAGAAAATTLPAMLAAGAGFRRGLHAHLTTGGRSTPAPGEGFLRRCLVVLQFGASVALLTAASLMLRGTMPTATAGPGFDPRDTLTLHVAIPGDAAERGAVMAEALARLRALPGVLDASAATPGAWLGAGPEDQVAAICPRCSDGTMALPILFGTPRHHVVTPDHFAAAGVPLLGGRTFGDGGGAGGEKEMVVDATFAARLLPGVDPVGQRVNLSRRWLGEESYRVVGVAGPVRAPGLGAGSEPVPALYLSAFDHPPREVGIAVRASGEPLALVPAVREALGEMDPRLRPEGFATMEALLAAHRAPLRWFGGVLVVLALGAVALAAGGLHGVMRHAVARRTRELGIRAALGAAPRDVVRQVVGEGLRLAGLGALVGLAAALSVARLLQLLFAGVRPFDAGGYAAAALLLTGVALLASWLPARAAAAADPLVAMRAE
jgi:putative ABC transport system permease protein